MTSCENVRTWKPHERKVSTVSTSTDRLDLRNDAFHFHGLHRLLHDVIVRLYLLAHIVVLMLDLYGCSTFTIFLVDEIHTLLHISLLLLIEPHIVITDDV